MKPERAQQLLALLNQTDPHLTYKEIAEQIGMTVSSVNQYAGLLTGLGMVPPRLQKGDAARARGAAVKPMNAKQKERFDKIERLRASGMAWRAINKELGLKGADIFYSYHAPSVTNGKE